MKKVMTEDVVNEICGAWSELFPNKNKFIVFENYIREIDIDDVDDFYPFGEKTQVDDVGLSIKAQNFIFDVNWVKDGMGLAFVVNSNTIEMYLCSNDGFDCFEPELEFVFKRTFDGLFD